MKDLFDLKGKVAVVAGASSGGGGCGKSLCGIHGRASALLARRKERLDEAGGGNYGSGRNRFCRRPVM